MKKQEAKNKKKVKVITAEELDRKFDDGEDIDDYINWGSALKKVNVDFPMWMVEGLDEEAEKYGVARQHVIKQIIGDRLIALGKKQAG